MAISRITGAFPFLACSLLICAAEVCEPTAAFAQTTGSSGELTQETEPGSGTPRSSEQAQENQQQPYTQDAATDAGCSIHEFGRDTWSEASQFGHGLKAVPRSSVRPGNLKWELPILAATGVLIAKVDRPADNRIQSTSLQQTAGRWSNIGLGLEIGSAALAYGIGCGKHHSYLRDTGLGKFWGGGRAFPSGHSATSFAFAAVIAHRYPKNKWIKWGAYALAAGVSLSRYPAKKHYPSDILMGATLGYVTGTYLAGH